MQENQSIREPMDLRLLFLRLWKQAGKILLITLLGVIVLGGGYYWKEFIHTPARYMATSLYQVEYVLDPVTGNEYTYINGTTWNQWLGTKEFLDLLYRNLEGSEDAAIDRDTMKGYLSARLQSDLRMPDTSVTTPDPELSLRLAAAVEKSMVDFAQGQKGIDNIRVVDPAAEAPAYTEAKPLNACILSAVLTFFLTVVILTIKELGSDSIWLPVTLQKRYGLRVLGTLNSWELKENTSYLLRYLRKAAVLPVGRETMDPAVMEALQKVAEPCRLEALPCVERHPQISGQLRERDGLILVIEAGPHIGRRLDAALEYLKLQECLVTAALLAHADEQLIRRYYWKERLWESRKRREARRQEEEKEKAEREIEEQEKAE